MSLGFTIPQRSKLIPIEVTFNAVYNATTPFQYDFNIPANKHKDLLELEKNKIYLLERFSFSLNIPEADYQTAIDTFPNPFLFLSRKESSDSPVYQKPWPLSQYYENNAHIICFETNQSDDVLQATFRAKLDQPASLIPIPELVATWSAQVYEIKDPEWIDWYNGQNGQGTFQ